VKGLAGLLLFVFWFFVVPALVLGVPAVLFGLERLARWFTKECVKTIREWINDE